MGEKMERWGEWTAGFFSQKHRPKMAHIPDLEWAKGDIQVPGNLKIARQKATLSKIITEDPETQTWINQEYDGPGVDRELRNLAIKTAPGSD